MNIPKNNKGKKKYMKKKNLKWNSNYSNESQPLNQLIKKITTNPHRSFSKIYNNTNKEIPKTKTAVPRMAILSTPELSAGESSLPEVGLNPAGDLPFGFNVAGAGATAGEGAAKILIGWSTLSTWEL